MNVLINFLSAVSGGALSYLRNLAPLLIERSQQDSHNALYLLINEQHRALLPKIPDSQLLVVDAQSSALKRMRFEKKIVPDLVKRHAIDTLFTPYQVAPYVANVKNITMIRNMEPFLHSGYPYSVKNRLRNCILSRSSKKTLRASDKVIAVSQFAADYCFENIKLEPTKVAQIYHGRDTAFSQVPNGEHKALLDKLGVSESYVFTCGSMLPYRRCELVIDAFLESKCKNQAQLVIAGWGTDIRYRRLIQERVKRAGKYAKILLLGHVAIDSMKALYANSRVFITATEIEACPNIAIEAMSAGCNIAASNNKPLPEIFAGAAHFFAKSDSLSSIAGVLDMMYEGHVDKSTIAKQRAEQFSWHRCCDETYSVLTQP